MNVVKEGVDMVKYRPVMSLSNFKLNIIMSFHFNLLLFNLQVSPFIFKQVLIPLDFLFKNVHNIKIMCSHSPSNISRSSSIVIWNTRCGRSKYELIPNPDLRNMESCWNHWLQVRIIGKHWLSRLCVVSMDDPGVRRAFCLVFKDF